MIKQFDVNKDTWGSSINFVDENNIMIGYDMDPQCCEGFGFSIECDLSISNFSGRYEYKDLNEVEENPYRYPCNDCEDNDCINHPDSEWCDPCDDCSEDYTSECHGCVNEDISVNCTKYNDWEEHEPYECEDVSNYIRFYTMDKDGVENGYIEFYNYHNGYYSHGYEMKDGDEHITVGGL